MVYSVNSVTRNFTTEEHIFLGIFVPWVKTLFETSRHSRLIFILDFYKEDKGVNYTAYSDFLDYNTITTKIIAV